MTDELYAATAGDIKIRLEAIFTERANRTNGIYNLSEEELYNLINSITEEGPIAINILERHLVIEKNIQEQIQKLQLYYYEAKSLINSLRSYIYMFSMLENAETLSNIILDHIKDIDERKKVAEYATKKTNFIFNHLLFTDEGYINIESNYKASQNSEENNEPNFLELVEMTRKNLKDIIIRCLSLAKAILDSMKDNDFLYDPYKNQVIRIQKLLKRPVTNWTKYIGELQVKNTNEIPEFERLRNLLKQYSISLDTKKLKVDKKQYDFFRQQM